MEHSHIYIYIYIYGKDTTLPLSKASAHGHQTSNYSLPIKTHDDCRCCIRWLSLKRGAIFHKIDVSRKLPKIGPKIIQQACQNGAKINPKSYLKTYPKFDRNFIDFWCQNGSKMEPKGVREHVFVGLDFHPGPLKSSMNPFSRKSKPPDLNFIKKVVLKLKLDEKTAPNI